MSIEDDILSGLSEFRDALKDGTAAKKLTHRKVKLNLTPCQYDPELIKSTRAILNVSQPLFAEFMGVSTSTLQAWEQGDNRVTGAAARLLDEIRAKPEYWQKRLLDLVETTAS
ncbi:MAG: hypothetical protein R3C18_14420 [Planctomycetaceae bacterium]